MCVTTLKNPFCISCVGYRQMLISKFGSRIGVNCVLGAPVPKPAGIAKLGMSLGSTLPKIWLLFCRLMSPCSTMGWMDTPCMPWTHWAPCTTCTSRQPSKHSTRPTTGPQCMPSPWRRDWLVRTTHGFCPSMGKALDSCTLQNSFSAGNTNPWLDLFSHLMWVPSKRECKVCIIFYVLVEGNCSKIFDRDLNIYLYYGKVNSSAQLFSLL